jgi:hypothetical protein
LEVADYKEEEAGTDKSVNLIFTLRVIDGQDKGKGGILRFNEKALGFGKKFWPLVINGWKGDGTDELSSDRCRQAVGKKIKAYVETAKSTKGNEFNDFKDFMPLA